MGDSKRRDKIFATAVAVVAMLVAAAWGGSVLFHPRVPARDVKAVASVSQASDPGQQLRMTLDPNLFKGQVKGAYQIAERDPALLAQLHCYCGCDRTNNHKNLLDCYRDDHGSHCAICVGEAVDAENLARQGMSVDQIRDTLRSRYAHGD